jgi:hypothetical protein
MFQPISLSISSENLCASTENINVQHLCHRHHDPRSSAGASRCAHEKAATTPSLPQVVQYSWRQKTLPSSGCATRLVVFCSHRCGPVPFDTKGGSRPILPTRQVPGRDTGDKSPRQRRGCGGGEVAVTLEGDLEGRAWLLMPVLPHWHDSAKEGPLAPSVACPNAGHNLPVLVVCPPFPDPSHMHRAHMALSLLHAPMDDLAAAACGVQADDQCATPTPHDLWAYVDFIAHPAPELW